MSDSEEFRFALPHSFQNRFASLGGYVKAIINEEEEDIPPESKLKGTEVQVIKNVVFLFLLNQLFVEGAKAAQKAVDEFAKYEIGEFYIGSTCFSKRNENVMLGETLSSLLMQECEELGLVDLFQRSHSIRDLTLELIRQVKIVRTLD